jgi:hypothetical protein
MVVDTINKTLSFYDDLEFGENKGLTIKYGAYLKAISKDIDAKKVATVVSGLGKNNLTATLATPTQTNEWEDYSYYLDGYAFNEMYQDSLSALSIATNGVITTTFNSDLSSR